MTFFGAASTPTDGASATNTADPTAVTPPGSMTSGDLVFFFGLKRNATGTIAISNAGGQTWNTAFTHVSSTAVLTVGAFYCIFNGTWAANPSLSFSATTNNTAVMVVFRPSVRCGFVGLDSGARNDIISSAAPSAGTLTVVSWTPAYDSNVSVVVLASDDDNTWTISGSGWTQSGLSAQYRNTSGSDTSCVFAYQIQSIAAATGQIALTQATNANDPAEIGRFTFDEGPIFRQLLISQSVKRAGYY